MIVGKGLRSGKEYTAEDKLKAFKEVVIACVKEQQRVDEIVTDSKASVKETIDYWIAEYFDPDDDKSEWTKEMKELFKIRIKEAYKQDKTTRNAFERELIMEQEAKGE